MVASAHGEGDNSHFQALLQSVADVVVVIDGDGRISSLSQSSEPLLGVALGPGASTILERIHPDDIGPALRGFQWLLRHPAHGSSAGQVLPAITRVRDVDGHWRTFEVLGRNLLQDPEVQGVLVTARDITEVRLTQELVAEGAAMLEAVVSGQPMERTLRALGAMVERWLPEARALVGFTEPDGTISVALSGLDDPTLTSALDIDPLSPLARALRVPQQPVVFDDLAGDSRWSDVGERVAAAGFAAFWAWLISVPDEGGELGLFGVFVPEARGPSQREIELCRHVLHLATVIVQRHRREARLAQLALLDDLTGLPNRTLVLDRIEQSLRIADRDHTQVAVLFCDVDRFKLVNDSLGHAAGDRLLRSIAERLASLVRTGDTVGRVGGDEFVVACHPVAGADGARELATDILDALAVPIALDEVEVILEASIGIALSNVGPGGRPASPTDLVRNADAAMYQAKARGGRSAMLFESGHREWVKRRFELERDLRRAVPGDELVLHYQPEVRISDRSVVGFEALVRWRRPGHGLVFPAEFVTVAEETGLIVPLGSWVLREVCRQAAACQRDPILDGLRLTANVSARQLLEPGLVDEIADVIRGFRLDPHRLCFEITESAVAGDLATAAAVLQRLQDLGVRLAIDDFGTGNASLEYVRRFTAADELKIPRQFVVGLDQRDPASIAIVSSMVVLARGLGLGLVAEGVETQAQFGILSQLGCDVAQGYLFGQPLPASELHDWVVARGTPVDTDRPYRLG
jgi:diguanylate cyclase (GGDEF)-like protein/PAS domain S-box-containing protein